MAARDGECPATRISRNVESRAVGPGGNPRNRRRLSRHTPTAEVGPSTPRCSRRGAWLGEAGRKSPFWHGVPLEEPAIRFGTDAVGAASGGAVRLRPAYDVRLPQFPGSERQARTPPRWRYDASIGREHVVHRPGCATKCPADVAQRLPGLPSLPYLSPLLCRKASTPRHATLLSMLSSCCIDRLSVPRPSSRRR